jgi:hypothetical protein
LPCGRVDHHVAHQEQTIAVILDFQNGRVRFFQEVEGATGDSTRCRRACEEICQPLDEVEVDAVEGVEAEREEMGAQEEAAGREAAQDIGEHVVR